MSLLPLYTPELDTDTELSQLLSKLDVSAWEKKLQLFQLLQEKHLRRPDLIVQHGYDLITKHKSKLRDQVWQIYERVFIASLDTHNEKISQDCLRALRAQFPSSLRVKRLNGMYAESHGRYDEAVEIYDEILEADPAHAPTLKRKIAVSRARSQWDRAIDGLQAYLQIFSQDEQAWIELAGIYLQQTKFELAKFCYEELLLLCPENYLHHILLADVLYTLDSKDKSAARHYYIQSLELKPSDNLRALYGLILCLRHAKTETTSSYQILYENTVQRILEHYQTQSTTELLAAVKEAITQ